jgi:tetraacyldisaccharide 4'-kinase
VWRVAVLAVLLPSPHPDSAAAWLGRRLRLTPDFAGGYLNPIWRWCVASAEWYRAVIDGRRRGPLAWAARAALWWARLPYAAGVGVRNWRYDRRPERAGRLAVPVVCVGNLTLGGTGKTVAAEYAAGFYRDLGRQVALVSRGYGGSGGGPNDEALVLEENLPDVPHLQGADRVEVATAAVEELEADVIVLDDGFQHRRLHRDLDVVLLDATRPVPAEYLFPRGLLREPVGGLKRAGFVLFSRCDQAEGVDEQRAWLAKRFPTLPHATTVHAPVELIGPDGAEPLELSGKSVAVFSGIGHPPAFTRTVKQLGATVTAEREFPDHHPYSREDVDDLTRWAAGLPADVETVLTTQKDWVKLRVGELGGRKLRAVRVGLKFLDGEAAFREKLRSVLGEQFTGAGE